MGVILDDFNVRQYVIIYSILLTRRYEQDI